MLLRYLILVPLFAPAAGAIALTLTGAPRRARPVAIASATLACLGALWMWVRFEPRGAEWQFDRQVDLVAPLGLRFIAGADGFSLSLVGAVTLVAMACAVWTIGRPADDRGRRAWIALLAAETGVVGVLVSLDLLQAAVFWAVSVTAALRAVRIEEGAGVALGGRRLTFVAAFAGIALAAVVLVLQARYRTLSGFSTFDLRALQTLTLGPEAQLWLLTALLPALAVPLCIAAARIHAAGAGTPTASAERVPVLVFVSSLLLPLGLYWLVRVGMTMLPGGVRQASPYVMAGCAIAAVAGGVAAIRKRRDFGIVVLSGGVIGAAMALAAALVLTPAAITGAVVLQIVQVVGAAALLLAATAGRPIGEAPARYAGVRTLVVLTPLTMAIAGLALRPAPLLARLETSVARVVLRVSPEYAAQVADCLSPTPPDPVETGLPAGMVIAAPCADGQHDARGKQ